MTEGRPARLRDVAAKLFWWKDPDAALADERRFLAQAMTYGSWDEMELVRSIYGVDALRAVLSDAPPGVFDRRSWSYWHVKLERMPVGDLATLADVIKSRLREAARRVDHVPIVGARSSSVLPPEAVSQSGDER